MEQVEEICEHIVLINKGENVLQGRVADIKDEFKLNNFKVEYEGQLPDNFADQFEIIDQQDQQVTVHLPEGTPAMALLQTLINAQVNIISYNEVLPSLNEIFIRQVEEETLPTTKPQNQ
jgi:ABC-2 type transport system ATP-binding protein